MWSGRNERGELVQNGADGRRAEDSPGGSGGEAAQVAPAALADRREYVGHIAEGAVMGALITIGFVALVVYLGKVLFNVGDWGRK